MTVRDRLDRVAALMGWQVTDTLLHRYMTDAMIHQLIDALDLLAAAAPVQGERPICVRCGGWADDPNVMHHPTKGCYGMPPLLPVQGEPQ